MPSVLFVCTANICRSPMAAALFAIRIQQYAEDWRDWRIESAGTWAVNGQPAAFDAQSLMHRRGLDISRHSSREISFDLLQRFELVLTMETGHKEALRVEFPQFASRIFMLSEMSGVEVSVMDPMGKSATAFEAAADQVDLLLVRGIERILYLGRGCMSKTQLFNPPTVNPANHSDSAD